MLFTVFGRPQNSDLLNQSRVQILISFSVGTTSKKKLERFLSLIPDQHYFHSHSMNLISCLFSIVKLMEFFPYPMLYSQMSCMEFQLRHFLAPKCQNLYLWVRVKKKLKSQFRFTNEGKTRSFKILKNWLPILTRLLLLILLALQVLGDINQGL